MNRAVAIVMIICSVVVAVIVFKGDPSSRDHEILLNVFQNIDTDYETLQRRMLQVRTGLLKSPDVLEAVAGDQSMNITLLRELLPKRDDAGLGRADAVQELAASIESDRKLARRFMMLNARLHVALRDFQEALAAMRSGGGTRAQSDDATAILANGMLAFVTGADDERTPRLRSLLDDLDRGRHGGFETEAVTAGREVVSILPTLDETLRLLTSSKTLMLAHQIRHAYLEDYSSGATLASWVRVFLGSVSVMLCGYVTFLVFRLRSQTDRLQLRLDLETVNSQVRKELNSETMTVDDALMAYARLFDADWVVLLRFQPLEIEPGETYSSVVLTDAHANQYRSLSRDLLETARRENERMLSRNLRSEDMLPLVHDAMSAGTAVCRLFDDSSAVIMLVRFAELRTKHSGDDVDLLQMAAETLGGTIWQYRAELERQNLERRLQHAQRLEAVGTLAGGIAHEFNNILGSMMGYAEMAERHLRRKSLAAAYIAQLMSSGARAQHIVDQILTLSRKRKRVRLPFDVGEVVKDVTPLLRMSYPDRLELLSDVSPRNLPIEGHPVELQQILINLCKNSVEASEGLAQVNLLVTDVSVPRTMLLSHGDLVPGRYVKVSVKDRGVGMTLEVLNRIFEPFYTTRSQVGGTGLGLAAVHGNLAALQGVADVTTEQGSGTVFTLYFPLTARKSIPLAEFFSERAVARGSGQQVAVLEEDKKVLGMIEDKLAALGYEPVGFTDFGTLAAALASGGSAPDLLMIDLTRVVTETQLEHVREIARDRRVLYFVDQSLAAPLASEFGLKSGALEKPLTSGSLSEAIAAKLSPNSVH